MNTITSGRRLSWMVNLAASWAAHFMSRLSAQSDNASAPIPAPPTAEAPKDASPTLHRNHRSKIPPSRRRATW